jgi:hypothetical protein
MMTLHPNILRLDGKKAFAVLSYDEFVHIKEELHDFEDLKDLRAAKADEIDEPTLPLASVRKTLKI